MIETLSKFELVVLTMTAPLAVYGGFDVEAPIAATQSHELETGSVTDIDGNTYKTVRIGTQASLPTLHRDTKEVVRLIVPKSFAVSIRCVKDRLVPDTHPELQAVNRAVSDYVEGLQSANADRVASAVHPEVMGVVLASYPQTGKPYLRKARASQLIEITRGGGGYVEESEREIEIVVHDIDHDMAAASVHSSRLIRYLQLGKTDGSWRIINVLSVPRREGTAARASPANIANAESAITETALDYIDGSFSGDAERMARALHPELTKVLLADHPGTGKRFLMTMGASDLIEGTRAQLGLLEEAKRNIAVTVYEVGPDIASAKVVSALYIDHLHLAKFEGNWKIVSVLWVLNPASSEG